jgi:hypothetical protein
MKSSDVQRGENQHLVTSSEARPFCFIVVVWGGKFCDYFLQYCLPSLLAPGNIPALGGHRPAEFIVCTTADDWRAMAETEIFRELQRHASPVFLELPPRPPERPNWAHSVVGHKLCCQAVFQKKAYRIFTVPDYIYADGAIARLNKIAASGAQAVLIHVQPRIDEKPFFALLEQNGILPRDNCKDSGQPLVCSARALVAAALQSLHSMTIVNEWTAPYFDGTSASPWWRVDDTAGGMVICGMGWNPLLIDYAAVPEHDVLLIDTRGLDGDYDMRTIGHLKTIYAVHDSDEIYAASWSSVDYMARRVRREKFGEWGKGTAFRTSYYAPHFNWLQRALMFVPVRLRAGPFGQNWDATEERALRTLLTWLDPPLELGELGRDLPIARQHYEAIEKKIAACELPDWRQSKTARRRIRNFLLMSVAVLLHPISCSFPNSPRMRFLIGALQVGTRRAWMALRGDRAARAWLRWRLRKTAAEVLHRPFHEARPNLS